MTWQRNCDARTVLPASAPVRADVRLWLDGLLAGRYSRGTAVEPVAEDGPLVLDIGTSAFMATELQLRARLGQNVPEGVGLDRDGNPTTDAAAIRDGGVLAAMAGERMHPHGAISPKSRFTPSIASCRVVIVSPLAPQRA